MATAPPPPPPPPKSRGKQPRSSSPPPTPEFAAIPFLSDYSPPVQETRPPPEATHGSEVHDAPQLPLQKGPPSPPSGQEDSLSDGEEKKHPVQETDPSQQMTERQNEEANPPDQAWEDQPT